MTIKINDKELTDSSYLLNHVMDICKLFKDALEIDVDEQLFHYGMFSREILLELAEQICEDPEWQPHKEMHNIYIEIATFYYTTQDLKLLINKNTTV